MLLLRCHHSQESPVDKYRQFFITLEFVPVLETVIPRLDSAASLVVAPVPPCESDNAVVSPDRLVISEFAPFFASDFWPGTVTGTPLVVIVTSPAPFITSAKPLIFR